MIADGNVEKIVGVLQSRAKEESSKKIEENEDLLQKIEELRVRNKRLEKDNEDLNQINSKKDEEVRRLNLRIEKYADDFKEFNDKQLQLNNQQQQLQARILEQTKQLKDSQEKVVR